jgi:hypothetical protein
MAECQIILQKLQQLKEENKWVQKRCLKSWGMNTNI